MLKQKEKMLAEAEAKAKAREVDSTFSGGGVVCVTSRARFCEVAEAASRRLIRLRGGAKLAHSTNDTASLGREPRVGSCHAP
jgi:hypothetical protein